MALFNKYRPVKFADLCGNATLISTLISSLQQVNPPQVFLFTGSRGTGKTSTARLVAKALNCKNFALNNDVCNECESCVAFIKNNSLAVVELDAASNRGIEDMRQIKDSTVYLPPATKWKVYIIDEAHMLSSDAFNSLLKIFEEPPKHVVFIMATTSLHKLPITILSRVQRYSFKLATQSELTIKLSKILKDESVSTDNPEELYSLLFNASGGSYRDAESLLEKLISTADGKIRIDTARSELGALSNVQVSNIYSLIMEGKSNELITELESLDAYGVSFTNLADLLADLIKEDLKLSLKPKLVSLFSFVVKFQIESKQVEDEANLFTLNLLEFMSKNN